MEHDRTESQGTPQQDAFSAPAKRPWTTPSIEKLEIDDTRNSDGVMDDGITGS